MGGIPSQTWMVRGVELSGSAAFVSVAGRHCVHCFFLFLLSLVASAAEEVSVVAAVCMRCVVCSPAVADEIRLDGLRVLGSALVSRSPASQSGVFLCALPGTTTALAHTMLARRPSSFFLLMGTMRSCARRRGRTRTQWLPASWSTTVLRTAVWARRSARGWCRCERLGPLRPLRWSVSVNGSADAKWC